jgi:hypothetical protein
VDGEENKQQDDRPTLPAGKFKQSRAPHKGGGTHA